ncbi:MAG: hypothetical protein D6714_20705 [Bacteroidetes bacterium]|nr:MAG: hypothetical protein D6714_20705 [Bacteroidota bacterium]
MWRALFFGGNDTRLRFGPASLLAFVVGLFVLSFRWKKVFSGQCSVGSVFHSNETRAGKSRERGNLCPLPKTNRTIHFSPKNKFHTA